MFLVVEEDSILKNGFSALEIAELAGSWANPNKRINRFPKPGIVSAKNKFHADGLIKFPFSSMVLMEMNFTASKSMRPRIRGMIRRNRSVVVLVAVELGLAVIKGKLKIV